MGNLYENTGSIASIGLTTAGPAMAHALQHGNGIQDQLMGLPSFDVGYETDTAGVVLK